MRVTISDDLYEAAGGTLVAVETLLQRALPLVGDPHALIVSSAQRTALADVLCCLPIRDVPDLLAKASKLADLTIGSVRYGFTAEQWEAIDARAARQGKTREQYLRQMLDQFTAEWTEIAVRA